MVNGIQVESEDDKREWIQQYTELEGVSLEYDKVVFNPGLRAIAKLCLNSLWGKMAQDTNPHQTVYTDDDLEIYSLCKDRDVRSMELMSGTTYEIVYKEKKDAVGCSALTNVAIAAFTTAGGRLKLYSGL